MKKHLGIFASEAVKKIFDGKKRVEIRLSRRKIPPFGKVSVGDTVYIKPSGQDIAGQFKVIKVIYIEGFESSDLKSLGKLDASDKKYLNSKEKINFATIIYFDQIEQFITSPIRVEKKDLRGWVVI